MKHSWGPIVATVIALAVGVGIGRAVVEGTGLAGAIAGTVGALFIVAVCYWRGYVRGSDDRRQSILSQFEAVQRRHSNPQGLRR